MIKALCLASVMPVFLYQCEPKWEETTLKNSPSRVDLHSHRRDHPWRVEETGQSLFFIDATLPNPNTTDMQHLLEVIDQYHERLRAALNIELDTIKGSEGQRRVNVWLYSPEPLEKAGVVTPDKPKMFYGVVNAAGVHLITREMAWDDPDVLRQVLHEVVHFWWADSFGEAPSLLNEGIAVYLERVLSTNVVQARRELAHFWQEYAARAEPGFLRRLCNNDNFWSERAIGEPVYEVGGQLVSLLFDNHGLPSLQRIFLESHYNDSHLPDHIKDVLGVSIDSLEQQIFAMTRSNR